MHDDHEAAEVDLLFKINRRQLEILHLRHKHLLPDEPLPTAQELAIQQQVVRLEAQAQELEDQLGVQY